MHRNTAQRVSHVHICTCWALWRFSEGCIIEYAYKRHTRDTYPHANQPASSHVASAPFPHPHLHATHLHATHLHATHLHAMHLHATHLHATHLHATHLHATHLHATHLHATHLHAMHLLASRLSSMKTPIELCFDNSYTWIVYVFRLSVTNVYLH